MVIGVELLCCALKNESVPAEPADQRAILVADLEAAPVAALAFPSAVMVAGPVAAFAAGTRRLGHGSYKHPRVSAATIAAQELQAESAASKV